MITTSEQTKQTTHSKIPSIIAAVICLIFALWSILWFWSAVLTVRPETVITQWEKSQKVTAQKDQTQNTIDEALVNTMIARLKQSLAINPLDAHTHILLARFYELFIITNKSIMNEDYVLLAEEAYKTAITIQPTNGYYWAKLANFYSATSQDDQKTIDAIDLTLQYRKYERDTQEIIIPIILEYWFKLPTNIKTQSKSVIQHAFKYHIDGKALINKAKLTNTLSVIEPLLTKKWHKDLVINYKKQLLKEKGTVNGQ